MSISYSYSNDSGLSSRLVQRLQFADDAAVINGNEKEKPDASNLLYSLVSVGWYDNKSG